MLNLFKLNIIRFNVKKYFEGMLFFLIILFPVLFISLPHVTTAWVTLLSFGCLIYLISNRSLIDFYSNPVIFCTLTVFLSYFFGIILSQIYWLKFNFHEYQQQGRFIILIPVFFYIYHKKINFDRSFSFVIPLAAITGTISSNYFFKADLTQWGARHTIAHLDPLNFGYLMLFFSFTSFFIGIHWAKHWWHRILCVVAFFCGLYMSLKSGSRTGWLAVPIVIFWMATFFIKLRVFTVLLLALLISLLGIIFYNFSDIAKSRVDMMVSEIISYSWNKNPAANDTSIGIRLSMLRMGIYLFLESPIFGFGVQDLYNLLNTESIRSHATDSTIIFSSSGFMHNELLTQAVRHGVFGVAAYIGIIGYSFYILKSLKITSVISHVFTVYLLFALTASLSTEILIVKPLILFFGFMCACFFGESLWKMAESSSDNSIIPISKS